jgi:hypothetical protein
VRIYTFIVDSLIKTLSIIFWFLLISAVKGALVDYAEPKFKKGDIVWAYNLDPGDRTDLSRVKGRLVRFYRFGDDVHWSVQDLRSKQGSCSEYKEQWLRPFEQESQGVTEDQSGVQ